MIEYLLFFVNILAALDIYRDSKNRKYGFLYPLLGLVLSIFGMVVYNLFFGGNVALAIKTKVEKGKPGPFAFLGSTFIVLGTLFFLGGVLIVFGEATSNTSTDVANLQSMFLLFAGISVVVLGWLFTRYDRKKRQKASETK